ncbi:catalase [Legionella clemsonensis]|uniref:Catalase n=1 Tax=Legionella clemsonensis TaxID=1867846 RepID=A0A222NZ13_9GAMM|nr:catalase [Legionella clemsonensis]ASQ44837.1 Catalase HPII [Legionella clemsonensis]
MDKKREKKLHENSKKQQMEEFSSDHSGQFLTTNHGLRINHTDDSLKAGARGPTIMEDFHFREKLTHFDHERIPERVVHARGSGAYGYFQVYESLEDLTMAKFLHDPQQKTPTFVRFSTVVGFRGSADTVRDVRGFATKFYTEQGNYDLVGNNMPIFFIQDGIKFPDLVHSIKPEQDNQMPQASAAHDTFWDFVANTPESAHMIMWVLSDRALPRSYRMMQGFGVHTFRFVNAKGHGRFVKFHWRPLLGIHSLVWDETQKIAGKDPDFNRRDLWEAIEAGHFPEFEFGIQVIEEQDEFKLGIDLLDATKIIPEELVPIRWVGKMTLNQNPENFFAETEQVAFHPGHVVPGIDFTNDPLLQGRLFSYLDTQLIRLSGPNFHEIPINRPLVPVSNNQREGYHRMTVDKGKQSYFPNTVAKGCPMTASRADGGYLHYAEKIAGNKVRERSESFKDFYTQASLFYNSMTDPEKKRIVSAFHFELGKVMDKGIRKQVVELFNHVDGELAEQIAQGIGVAPPAFKKGKACDKIAKNLSQETSEHTAKNSIATRKIAILVAEGYSATELKLVRKALVAEGAVCDIIAQFQGPLKSDSGDEVDVDKHYATTASVLYDAVFIPGGSRSIKVLAKQGDALNFINEAFKHCKPLGATGDGVDLLMLSSIKGVTYSAGELQNDQGVVTIKQHTDLMPFIDQFKAAIAQHRHWQRNMKDEVPA